jgi:hypothetical protein
VTVKPTIPDLEHLQLVIEGGGFSIAIVGHVGCVAAASDGDRCLAMLARRPDESLIDLLRRLDDAVAIALKTGERIDEINAPITSAPSQTKKSRR